MEQFSENAMSVMYVALSKATIIIIYCHDNHKLTHVFLFSNRLPKWTSVFHAE